MTIKAVQMETVTTAAMRPFAEGDRPKGDAAGAGEFIASIIGVGLPPASPPPLHPRRGEGELEYPILFFCFGEVFLNRGVAMRVCWPRLGNDAVVVNGLMIGVAAAVGAVVFLLVVAKVMAATTSRAARQ